MKEPQNDNPGFFYHKIDRERKSPQKTAPEFAVNPSVEKWIPRDVRNASITNAEELLPESGRLRFVPCVRPDDVFLDFREESKAVRHFLFSIAP